MNIIVTGLPRTRSSQVVNLIANNFNLIKPLNQWGETHATHNEDLSAWINRKQCVFKLWPPFSSTYQEIINSYEGNIIVSYTEDIPLFVAKLLRSEVTSDWGINLRALKKISFTDSFYQLESLVPTIKQFLGGLDQALSSKTVVLKSAFINDDAVSVHVQSSFNDLLAESLRTFSKSYKKSNLDDYFSEGKEEFYEYVCKNIGRRV